MTVAVQEHCVELAMEETDAAMDGAITGLGQKVEEAATTVEVPPLP